MVVAQNQFVTPQGEMVSEGQGYEQVLRAIGQALEGQALHSFELMPVGNKFFVLGRGALAQSGGKLRALWLKLANLNRDRRLGARNSAAEKSTVEIQYTLEDIERLESGGRARRAEAHQMANASSLSQVLRCVGAYLHQKHARLVKVTCQGASVILEYMTSLGNPMNESFDAKELYDMWVRMYLQRGGRTGKPMVSSASRES
jgi:hypothetical protein